MDADNMLNEEQKDESLDDERSSINGSELLDDLLKIVSDEN